jgi:hypothetical protein
VKVVLVAPGLVLAAAVAAFGTIRTNYFEQRPLQKPTYDPDNLYGGCNPPPPPLSVGWPRRRAPCVTTSWHVPG